MAVARAWASTICSTLGFALGGPLGGLVGTLGGSLLSAIVPGASPLLAAGLTRIATRAIDANLTTLQRKITGPERQQINHDLQRSFRDALSEALLDVGGKGCFPEAWATQIRDVPQEQVYPLTPEGQHLWQDNKSLAEQVALCLRGLQSAIPSLLPLDPPVEQQAASVYGYLDSTTAMAMNQAFYNQVIAPYLVNFSSLLSEVPGLERHLRLYLLDRTLIHLGEFLKTRTKSFVAYNRYMLEGLRAEAAKLETGQEEVLQRLDGLLNQPDERAMTEWAAGSWDGKLWFWNAQQMQTNPSSFDMGSGFIHAIAFSPDSRWFVYGSDDGVARVYDVVQLINGDTKAAYELRGNEGQVQALAFSKDGRYLAVGGWDGLTQVYDMQTLAAEPLQLRLPAGAVQSLSFSTDNRILAVGGPWAYLWHLNIQDILLLAC